MIVFVLANVVALTVVYVTLFLQKDTSKRWSRNPSRVRPAAIDVEERGAVNVIPSTLRKENSSFDSVTRSEAGQGIPYNDIDACFTPQHPGSLQLRTTILWYPLVYIILVMLLSVGRLESMLGGHWTPIVCFLGAALYACEGWCTVLLYTSTREGVISWNWFAWIKLPDGILDRFVTHNAR